MSRFQRVLFVRPFIRDYFNSRSSSSFESSIGLVPPLNLCCLAASVKRAGFEAAIYDFEAEGSGEEDFVKTLREKQPHVVGISAITTNFRGALGTARLVRESLPEAVIICGGTHMMIYPRETMSFDEFDYGFVGEADDSLVSFLKSFDGDASGMGSIPGLVRRGKEGIIVNQPFGLNEDLDRLPFPAYELLDLAKYRMPNTSDNVISLFLSRGCPFKCGFCFRNPLLRRVRFKTVEMAIEEITYMVERFAVRSVNFVDETITLRKRYFMEFCARLKAKNFDLEWQAPTRVDRLDDDIVRAAKESGCHTLRLGIESGSDEILERIGKRTTTRDALEAVRLCKKHGIRTVGYFIIGYLGETENTIMQTIRFAKSLGLDYAGFFPATPMPSTRLYDESVRQGLVPEHYWRDFVLGVRNDPLPFIHPEAETWTARAYRAFYFSPGHIMRQMRKLGFYRDFLNNLKVAWRLLTMKFKRAAPGMTPPVHSVTRCPSGSRSERDFLP
ncbi:MAG: radical SAM protein [Deltaproteobacteria bacterium]|nr:radical SAM protein [Deltaproteobacteria bacterium]